MLKAGFIVREQLNWESKKLDFTNYFIKHSQSICK